MVELEINLPIFPGFYSGYLKIEELVDEETLNELNEDYDWNKFLENTARIYYDLFIEFLPKPLKEILTFEFIQLFQPRFYNYSTDKIVCMVTFDKTLFIHYFLINMDKELFENHLLVEFTSRDGFVSWYSNDLDEWLYKLILDCDVDNIIFETMLEHILYMRYESIYPSKDSILDEERVLEYLTKNLTL